MTGPENDERGSASILMLMIGLCILSVAAVACLIAVAVQARHQAQTGADAAALAGAMRVAEGPQAACQRANELASANNSAVTSCTVTGSHVTIEVAVTPPMLDFAGDVTARARAGPVPGQDFGPQPQPQPETDTPIGTE